MVEGLESVGEIMEVVPLLLYLLFVFVGFVLDGFSRALHVPSETFGGIASGKSKTESGQNGHQHQIQYFVLPFFVHGNPL
jgi:hypothetical protein